MATTRTDLPDLPTEGIPEPARLFPVLAESKKEGRATSVFLACLSLIPAFGRVLMEPLGVKVSRTTSIRTFTEVTLAKSVDGQPNRPDGLIAIRRGRQQVWTALVEAKVGSRLDEEQVASYLKLAKDNKVDALITISNDFAAMPTHHPLRITKLPKNVGLYHWSWASVLTHAQLLLTQGVDDLEQRMVLGEFVRFLEHPSSGVKRFDRMDANWPDIVNRVVAGGHLERKSDEVADTVASWHQETRDLALLLAKHVNANVAIRLSKAHKDNSAKRIEDDAAILAEEAQLRAAFDVPDAVSPMAVVADLRRKSIEVSMSLDAPGDRRTTAARVNWLLKQLGERDAEGLHIFAGYRGRSRRSGKDAPLASVRKEPRVLQHDDGSLAPASFEIKLVREPRRFSGKEKFVDELEAAVLRFYEQVGQRLKRWQPAAPKMSEAATAPSPLPPASPPPASPATGELNDVAQDAQEGADTRLPPVDPTGSPRD